MGIAKEKLVGEPVLYVVGRKKTFTIPDELDDKCVFILEAASLVPYDGHNFNYAVWPKKQFVPSFDKEKEESTRIISWASRTPADEARVKIYANIDIETQEIKVTGSGFEYVTIHMYRLNKESEKRSDLPQSNLDKMIQEEWDKIKDTLKRKDFEHFKEVFIVEYYSEKG